MSRREKEGRLEEGEESRMEEEGGARRGRPARPVEGGRRRKAERGGAGQWRVEREWRCGLLAALIGAGTTPAVRSPPGRWQR